MKSIKLDNASYQEYLAGRDVVCGTSTVSDKELREGEHVMVFRDNVASNSAVTPPKGEMQSEYIGVEGQIVNAAGSGRPEENKIVVRKV